MSTGYECMFIHRELGWFYILQNWNCPVGAFDWREHATCYGPFDSFEEAHDHLRDNHANPGGYITDAEDCEPKEIYDDTERVLMENASL